jgi:hypothetical protein
MPVAGGLERPTGHHHYARRHEFPGTTPPQPLPGLYYSYGPAHRGSVQPLEILTAFPSLKWYVMLIGPLDEFAHGIDQELNGGPRWHTQRPRLI